MRVRSVGALLIRIGFGDILCYNFNYSGTYISMHEPSGFLCIRDRGQRSFGVPEGWFRDLGV